MKDVTVEFTLKFSLIVKIILIDWLIAVQYNVSNFSTLSWWVQVIFWWDEDNTCFVLDDYTQLNIYSVYRILRTIGR